MVLERLLVATILLGSLALGGCAAPVKLTGYPSATAAERSLEDCRSRGFQDVRVIGLLPPAGTYEELGYMTVEQSSTSEFVYTSIDKQIDAARIRACQWGADAIVVVTSDGDKKNTWSFWSGMQYHDERESRIVAIRFIEAVGDPPGGGFTSVSDAERAVPASSPVATESKGTTIAFELDHPARVLIEIVDRNDELVRLLLSKDMDAGNHRTLWDGRNESGSMAPDGTYRYRVFSDDSVIQAGKIEWPLPSGSDGE